MTEAPFTYGRHFEPDPHLISQNRLAAIRTHCCNRLREGQECIAFILASSSRVRTVVRAPLHSPRRAIPKSNMAATLWASDDASVWEENLDALEVRMKASGKSTKYGSLKALHKKWANLQGQSELSKEDLILVVGYKLMRGKMRPLMRFAEAMVDGEVRKTSKAAISLIPDAAAVCDALTALTGVGVATASVCIAAVDERLPIMSDEALEAVLGEPEHSKKYDLGS